MENINRRYWSFVVTGKTWEEFMKHGANVVGFSERRRKYIEKIRVGDYLFCYLAKVQRIIGVLEVRSECYLDNSPIWEDALFPCRLKVKPIYILEPKTALPISEFKDKLSISSRYKSNWGVFFHSSGNEFPTQDGEIIVDAVRTALKHPVERDYDEKRYWSRPSVSVYESKIGKVTIPQEDKDEVEAKKDEDMKHTEIQWLLLKVGSDLGLGVWVARNDRNKEFNGKSFKDIPNLKSELPRQFDEATNRTIELIVVLWLEDDAIIAAFEIEHSTTIYSGLLRMADLVSMQPNIKLDLYIVAPDERREKVFNEINRPTFAKLRPPLPKICMFLPYSRLKREVEQFGNRIRYMKPEFIKAIAESCEV